MIGFYDETGGIWVTFLSNYADERGVLFKFFDDIVVDGLPDHVVANPSMRRDFLGRLRESKRLNPNTMYFVFLPRPEDEADLDGLEGVVFESDGFSRDVLNVINSHVAV